MAGSTESTIDRKAKWAARAYQQGTPLAQIARQLDTTTRTIHRWLLRAGITPNRVKPDA